MELNFWSNFFEAVSAKNFPLFVHKNSCPLCFPLAGFLRVGSASIQTESKKKYMDMALEIYDYIDIDDDIDIDY